MSKMTVLEIMLCEEGHVEFSKIPLNDWNGMEFIMLPMYEGEIERATVDETTAEGVICLVEKHVESNINPDGIEIEGLDESLDSMRQAIVKIFDHQVPEFIVMYSLYIEYTTSITLIVKE